MSAEMAVWLRNCLCLYSYLHNQLSRQLNRNVFRCLLKVSSETSTGKLFHATGPLMANSCHHRLSGDRTYFYFCWVFAVKPVSSGNEHLFGVTTYVESVEMLGNLAAVRELTENLGNFGEISPGKTVIYFRVWGYVSLVG